MRFLAVLLLLILTFPAISSLLVKGAYTSHDLTHHVIRQVNMDKLLSEGQFPPRWSGDLNNGYGYPLFLFNYPLPPLLGELFHKLGFGFIESVKMVLLASMVISVIGMYLFLVSLIKSKLASFTGAVFYLYAPVRFINIYVSAAVGSALALGIIPFIFLFVVRLFVKRNIKNVLMGSVCISALILSHNVTTMIFLPLILTFSGLLVFLSKDKRGLLKHYLLMFLLGFGIAAFFWLPALAEKQFTRYDIVLPRFWVDHFPTLRQLIYSPWGYGLSNLGPDDSLSFQIGLIHILVIVLLVSTMFIYRKKKEFLYFGTFTAVFFIISVFFMLDISTPFWDTLPFLNYVQFPSRFLAVAVFCAAISAALIVKYLPFNKFIFAVFIFFVLYANRNHLNVNERLNLVDADYISSQATSTMAGEHLPPWEDMRNEKSPGKIEFIEGAGTISYLENKSAKVVAEVKAQDFSKIRFNQTYFPGWEIEVNDQKINFDYLEKGKSYGLPVFNVNTGKNIIRAQFKNTFIRNLGDLISVMSVCIFLILFAIQRKFRSVTLAG